MTPIEKPTRPAPLTSEAALHQIEALARLMVSCDRIDRRQIYNQGFPILFRTTTSLLRNRRNWLKIEKHLGSCRSAIRQLAGIEEASGSDYEIYVAVLSELGRLQMCLD